MFFSLMFYAVIYLCSIITLKEMDEILLKSIRSLYFERIYKKLGHLFFNPCGLLGLIYICDYASFG